MSYNKGKNNPNYKNGVSLKTNYCLDCKKIINYKSKRCNSCAIKGKRNIGYKHGKWIKKHYCQDCGKQLTLYTAKRCIKCWYKFNSGKNHYLYKERNRCIDCKTEINRVSKRCNKCYHKYIQDNKLLCGDKNPQWQGGISFEPYPLGWNKTHREQIRYRDKYKCQMCGCPEVECNRKLHVHHIDYDKNNINPNNLISLCNSCHVKTNFNRKYWQTLLKGVRNE